MISIVIPALNEEKFLPDCLESLRNQDYAGEYEIIVADNGSRDRTVEIARSFGARVVICSEKKGVAYARQAGADAAIGDIIVQADADTVYPRHWLARIGACFATHPGAVALAGRFFYRDPPSWAVVEYMLRHTVNWLTTALFNRPLAVSGATFAFRRRAFLSEGGYRGLSYSPDQYGISARLSKRGGIIYDRDLCVLTSARSVEKPFLTVVLDLIVHINRWASYAGGSCLDMVQEFTGKTRPRRIAARMVPAVLLVVLFFSYGYFIPSSPAFGKVYYKGSSAEKVVALTFDDGPNEPYTSQIMDILAARDVKATFFVIGKNVEFYPETARRILADGHVVGNHSYSHSANHALTPYGQKDMSMAQVAIFTVVGVWPHLYRPPHGKKSPWELEYARKTGLIEVTWSVSTYDQKAESAEDLAQRIVAKADPGEIILLHDGYGTLHAGGKADKSLTVEAVPLIIEGLKARGYGFVTVPDLLDEPAYLRPPDAP